MVIHAHTPVVLHELSNDSIINYGSGIRLHVKGAYYYYWQPQGCIDNPNMEDPIVHPTEPTIFTVIGYNQFGCNDSAHVKVDLSYPDHFVPSVFSPNGDGKNDVFVFLLRRRECVIDKSAFPIKLQILRSDRI